MIKLTSDIQKEILKFLFSPESGEDLSDAFARPYMRNMSNTLEKEGYIIIKKDANIRVMKNAMNSIVIDITTIGNSDKGMFISASMESFDGSPFYHIAVFDADMTELEMIGV